MLQPQDSQFPVESRVALYKWGNSWPYFLETLLGPFVVCRLLFQDNNAGADVVSSKLKLSKLMEPWSPGRSRG